MRLTDRTLTGRRRRTRVGVISRQEGGPMRVRKAAGGVSVHAIAGTYVVMLGMDAEPQARAGLLGFAIERIDKTEHEQYWLTGMRTFKSVYPNPPQGALVSSREHPIQDFLWSDFTA